LGRKFLPPRLPRNPYRPLSNPLLRPPRHLRQLQHRHQLRKPHSPQRYPSSPRHKRYPHKLLSNLLPQTKHSPLPQ